MQRFGAAELDRDLLTATRDDSGVEGSYNQMHFVLRLSQRNHHLLEGIDARPRAIDELSVEQIEAFSTYLHETIHWWQHVGSTSGLVVSLAYPVQFNGNAQFLTEIVAGGVRFKSVKQWAEDELRSGRPDSDPLLIAANSAVNNCIDIEFYKRLAIDPSSFESVNDRYFESVGHCYRMAYSHALNYMAATVDPNINIVPGGSAWDDGFQDLADRRILGYYYGSPVVRGMIGLHAICEGQAIYSQIQFLSAASGGGLCIDDFYKDGYLHGIYAEAFDAYIEKTGFPDPDTANAPQVAIFLLICDLATNPGRGLPFQISKFEDFIYDVDPAIRFHRLCLAAKKIYAGGLPEVFDYSKETYTRLSELLSAECGYDSPMAVLYEFQRWSEQLPILRKLEKEKETFCYAEDNLPLRVILSHFMSFCRDKIAVPEFFCWPGMMMVGDLKPEYVSVWLSNLSLYSNRLGDEGVFPRDIPGKDRECVLKTLNVFYAHGIMFDLTKQWILENGKFRFDYRWLKADASEAEFTRSAGNLFESVYGVRPEAIKPL